MDNVQKIVSFLATYGLKSNAVDLAGSMAFGTEYCLQKSPKNEMLFIEHMQKEISHGHLGKTLEIVNGEKFKEKMGLIQQWDFVPEWFLVFFNIRKSRKEDGFELYTPISTAKMMHNDLFECESGTFFKKIIPEEKQGEMKLKHLFNQKEACSEAMRYMMQQVVKMKTEFEEKKRLQSFKEELSALLGKIYEEITMKFQ